MKKVLLTLIIGFFALGTYAQRVIDKLDRGLVAVQTTKGVFVSWRIQSDEYYDVTYNLYRNGSPIAQNLTTSNYTDANGNGSSSYKVETVKRGVKTMSDAVTPWTNSYKEITPKHPAEIHSTLVPNDACCADVDGDGVVEILLKFDNQSEVSNRMQKNGYYNEYSIFEVLKLDGTVLWWVNCGPNMGDFQNNEQNIVGYDWDMDGKAEVLMRLEEGSVIHMANGETYTIGADGKNGTSWTNYREPRGLSPNVETVALAFNLPADATASTATSWLTTSIKNGVLYATTAVNPTVGDGTHGTGRTGTVTLKSGSTTTSFSVFQLDQDAPSVEWFTHYGKEFLVYCNGLTGTPYQVIDFPCARFESGESNLNTAWGDVYGHRSSKFFYGAPYLDGRKPSIFLGRGIYTRHKFVALDVDPTTHQLTERWRWMNNQKGSPWYGQGYHNYAIVDVDWDGRDEIVFGGLVIDDNGKGLSTVGFGHGDAQHHGDLNPYVHGQEGFFANEDRPNNHYRDLTTAKLYYRSVGSNDDGRAIAGNFLNTVPGAVGFSAHDSSSPVGLVANKHLDGYGTSGMAQNFRCYWDGDLQEESFNYSNGKNTAGAVYKPGTGSSWILEGSMTNNDTKGTPCYMGDILGDWREEFIMRTADNKIRIYTTTIETKWRNYSLWYDHQYRNGMVWEMCGYNQPPHVSYFIGELEGITAAPPALTMEGRTEVANGATIGKDLDDKEVITCETNDMTINITDGAAPYLFIDNAPSWVQGSAPSEATSTSYTIKYQYYTHTLQGGGFAGSTRVVKQGDGILAYPEKDMTYSGNTDVWAGTLNLNGSIANSPLWLNRLTYLNTTSARNVTVKSLAADYGSTITIGGENAIGTLAATDSLKLGFGSRLKMDVYAANDALDLKADQITTAKLIVETKDWQYGPEYKQPVIEFNCHFANGETTLTSGKYILGSVTAVSGDIANIKIEGIAKVKATLALENGVLALNVEGVRDAADIEWNATHSNIWDMAVTENFVTHDPVRATETFIEGDNVYFTDNSNSKNVEIASGVEVKPTKFFYTGSEAYTIGGEGKIAAGAFYHQGSGAITMNNENTYTGGNHLAGGTTIVSTLANSMQTYGNLGGMTTNSALFTIENGAVLQNTAAVTNGSAMKMVGSGVLQTDAAFTQQGVITGDSLVKTGSASLTMSGNLSAARAIVKQGEINYSGSNYTKVVELQGTSSIKGNGFAPSPINVASGAKATLTLSNSNYTKHSGALTGTGQLTIVPTNTVNRVAITGNWTNFKGTVVYNNTSILMPLKNSGMPNATLSIGVGTNIGIAASSSAAAVTYPIGKLIGSGTLRHKETDFESQNGVSGNVTWKIGSSDLGNFTFDGVIYDAGSTNKSNFEKVGDCAMTVGGVWQNSGTVKVSAGSLIIGQGKTLGTGALTVANGGTLMGMSSTIRTQSKKSGFTNSSITIDGALRVGTDGLSTTGYWYFGTKPLTFNATGKLYVGVAKCATSTTAPGCTHIWGDETSGSVTFKDGATISVYLASTYDPTTSIGTDEAKADSFFVFNFPQVTMGEVQFELPELPVGYYWDTTKFSTGYLYVRVNASVGIKAPFADTDPNNIYDLSGRLIRRLSSASELKKLPAGIYIRGGKKVVVR